MKIATLVLLVLLVVFGLFGAFVARGDDVPWSREEYLRRMGEQQDRVRSYVCLVDFQRSLLMAGLRDREQIVALSAQTCGALLGPNARSVAMNTLREILAEPLH